MGRIVFPFRGANGAPQLATRLLAQDTSKPLPGTESGAAPFFSPDGQWIAFAADGKLKKTSVVGGAPIVLCDAPIFRGGSWGEDGTIVAALAGRNGLSRIPAFGGTPQPLTTLVNGEQTHRWPQILPGAQSILFTASTIGGQYEEATVQVLAVKTGQITTLVHGGYFGRYVSGYVTYVHQGVLFGLAFDLARLEVKGTPVGKPEVFLKTPAVESQAAFSPDGRWVAYTSNESGRNEMYVRPFHNAAGGKWQISTSGGASSFWSRDGRALYYVALDNRIMVVEYTVTGDAFAASAARVWSETPVRTSLGNSSVDLAPDGKRFAILPRDVAADEKGSVHATFLLNFFDELHRWLPQQA